MTIDTNTIVSMSEANQNFSKVARLTDQYGAVTIMKNNKPRYMVIDFSQYEKMQAAEDDAVMASSNKLMKRNKKVYEELAK